LIILYFKYSTYTLDVLDLMLVNLKSTIEQKHMQVLFISKILVCVKVL